MDDSEKNMMIDPDATMPGRRDRKSDGRFEIGDLIMTRYKVLAELGQGGMGVVYKCFDEIAGIEIALKALPPELSHNSLEMEDIRDNFQIVHNLHHPRIAAYNNLERDPANGNYYLIMECCHGEDLRRWIRRKRREDALTPDAIHAVIKQVADAMDYAHEIRIIHRDIKPGNIMIDAGNKIKILDFGLAAQIHTSMTRVSMVNYGTSGTGPYMAPEQWRGKSQGAAADQYALAVITYEMLAGKPPFESSDIAILREAVLHEDPDPIPNVPDGIQAAVFRAMSKNPADRFPSCGDFANALIGRQIMKQTPVQEDPNLETQRREMEAKIVADQMRLEYEAQERRKTELQIQESKAQLRAERRLKREVERWYRAGVTHYNRKNYAEAVKWYTQAAVQGHARAQCNLGFMYEKGYGVTQNYQTALEWYLKAAKQKEPYAQNNLGKIYEFGLGVKADLETAKFWYKKAAEHGMSQAQKDFRRLTGVVKEKISFWKRLFD